MKRVHWFLSSISVLIIVSGFSQAPDVSWIKMYRPAGFAGTESIATGFDGHQLSDNGYISTGVCVNPWLKGYIVRTNPSGDSIWTKQHFTDLLSYGNFTSTDIEKTGDGGYILAGYGTINTQNLIRIVKIGSTGEVAWTKYYASQTFDTVFVTHDMKIAPDNGIIIAGTMGIGIGEKMFAFLIKFTAEGNFEWFGNYGDGTSFEEGLSVENAVSAGYVLVSRFDSGGFQDLKYRKINVAGSVEFSVKYVMANKNVGDYMYIRKTNDNNYVICGSDLGDYFLMKINESGDQAWLHNYLGTSEDEKAHCVYQTSDNGYVVCGTKVPEGGTENITFVLKTDPDGGSEWTKFVTINDFGQGTNRIEQTADGGYIIFGSARLEAGGADYLMIMKLGGTSGIVPGNGNILHARLDQNFPNPFTGTTEIRWFQDQKNRIRLSVVDPAGREIALLLDQVLQAGEHAYQFLPDAAVEPGIYYYRLETRDEVLTRKMVLTR